MFARWMSLPKAEILTSRGQCPLIDERVHASSDCLRKARLLDSRADYVAGAKNCSPRAIIPIAAIQLPLARSAMACQLPLACRNAIAQAIVNVMVTYPTAVTPKMNST